MKIVFHSSSSRGAAKHGWLVAKHSFSFANWYNPERMHFGALRVLNDDTVAKGAGFGRHPHANMEIITIPLAGSIQHQDSMGNSSIIQTGEIQVMSAGTGVEHSEYNPSKTEELKLFQIWIFPNKQNVTPRYDQFTIDTSKIKNIFLQLVSPNPMDEGTWIHQNAWVKLAEIDEKKTVPYTLQNENNGVYFMAIDGVFKIGNYTLNPKDAAGVWHTQTVDIFPIESGRILAIEVPMLNN